VIYHVIPIKEDHKPFKQKLRRINPLLLPLIENEIKNLFEDKIIVCLRFSKWVENMVPVVSTRNHLQTVMRIILVPISLYSKCK
jgi:hypothetical protein